MSMEPDKEEAKKTIKLNYEYELSNPTCHFCNGYYGSCFEEPVCAICHLFLFPREWNLVYPLPIFTEKTDDDDSGNDEPNEHYLAQASNQSPAQANYPSSLPTPPQYGPLEKRNSPNIGPSDELSSGLIQSLPPEGLQLDPPQGIRALPLDSKYCHWQASITGPVGSPYEGGNFYLYVQVPYSYPMEPPIVKFLTKIFHPNVSRHGDVGLDSINHNWSLALTISKILVSIQSLLTDPFCEICMEPEVGKLYIENKDFFVSVARAWTWKYAMHDVIQPRI